MNLVNIHTKGRKIYLFLRSPDGKQEIRTVEDFFPYYYEKDPLGKFKAFTGESLRKIFVSEPREIRKQATPNAYESDINLGKRYLIDKVDKLDKTCIKYFFIDIECLTTDMPDIFKANKIISCISVYNSQTKGIKTFYLKDKNKEWDMLEAFMEYIKAESPDICSFWNANRFDYPYLHNRIPNFAERISPVGEQRYGIKLFDGDTPVIINFPVGISIVDYMDLYKKLTLNKEEEYSLDFTAQKILGEGKRNKDVDFSQLSDIIVARNKEDVRIMSMIEDKKKILEYYDEVRRTTKVEWEDLLWNSRLVDSLLLQEAKHQNLCLPSKKTDNEKEEFEGAFRQIYKRGRLKSIFKYDLSSAYPYGIINFCLDIANISESPTNNSILIENTNFIQNKNALLPTIIQKLITLKNQIKIELESFKVDDPRYKEAKIRYNAVKSLVNSAYGVASLKFFRLYDTRVASATTFIVRSLLHYVKDELERKNISVVYVDTDSIFTDSKKDISVLLNELVQRWAKEKFGKDHVDIEFAYEGKFISLLLLEKCRYVGNVEKPNGEIEKEVKGVEIKRKDSTKFIKNFQTTLIDKILDNETKESIFDWIRTEIKNFKNNKLIDIAFPAKATKPESEYTSLPIFMRALRYAQEKFNFKKASAERFYWLYVNSEEYEKEKKIVPILDGELMTGNILKKEYFKKYNEKVTVKLMDSNEETGKKKNLLLEELAKAKRLEMKETDIDGKNKDVIAFTEDYEKFVDNVDWDTMLNRNIYMKLETIFDAMDWKMKEINEDYNDNIKTYYIKPKPEDCI